MYISRPCALGRKQSNEGLGAGSLAASGAAPRTQARAWVPAARPAALAPRLQLFVLEAVGAPRQRRLEGTALGLGGFGKEFENRREALPGSELVTVGACRKKTKTKKHRRGYEGPRSEPSHRLRVLGPEPGPNPASRPAGPAPSGARPLRNTPLPACAHTRPRARRGADSAEPVSPQAAPGAATPSPPPPPASAPLCPRRRDAAPTSPRVARAPRGLSPAGPIEARGGKGHSLSRLETTPPPRLCARARGCVSPRA